MLRSPGWAPMTPGHSAAYASFQPSRSYRSFNTEAGSGARLSMMPWTSGGTCSHGVPVTPGAGLDRAALLEPGVPGDAHPGQLGDLLPAQPGGAAAQPRGQPHLLRADPLPAAAQERGQLSTARTVPVGRHGGHNLIMPGSGGRCQVLLVPG